MEALDRKQTRLFNQLKTFETFVNNLPDQPSDALFLQLESRLNDILHSRENFLKNQDEIEDEIPLRELEKHALVRNEYENLYYSISSQARIILRKNTQVLNVSPKCVEPQMNVKLPMIHLPKFSGETDCWLEFRDTFTSLIHSNETLSDIQKFHYLRASLVGKAAEMLKNMQFSSDSYSLAWNNICERFNDKRLLIFNHIKSIFGVENIHKESALKLRHLEDTITKHLRSLKNLINDETQLWHVFVVHLITSKLDITTCREWEQIQSSEIPTVDDLSNFIRNKASLLEKMELKRVTNHNPEKFKSTSRSFVVTNNTCPVCNQSHYLYKCETFLKLDANSRQRKVEELALCKNCLQKNHSTESCKSKWNCRKCKARHNTILHDNTMQTLTTNPTTRCTNPETMSAFSSSKRAVLLSTIMVKIRDNSGKYHHARVLLDSGSQSNFISLDLCNRLNLKKSRTNTIVTGISGIRSEIQEECIVFIESLNNPGKTKVHCLISTKLACPLPNFHIDIQQFKIPEGITLADPTFYEPSPVDILIGGGLFWDILRTGKRPLGKGLPQLQETAFGWVIAGSISTGYTHNISCNLSHEEGNAVHQTLLKFWELEEIPLKKPFSYEERICEEHFVKTHTRNQEGRFVVFMPLKQSPTVLGDSYKTAEKQFLNLERKLSKNIILYNQYRAFMNEYLELNHMAECDPKRFDVIYYLPHHAVVNDNSLTTKLRVVFNGSARSDSGYSLNSIQIVGPTIQPDIITILMRFRERPIAICADIEKMYRQVEIHPSQQNLQCILWRFSPTEPLKTYALKTVTYGTAAAPHQAIRSLHELGNQIEDKDPYIANVIKTHFYVDDLVTGADTIEEAQHLIGNVTKTLAQGCFKLRKWLSNDPQIFACISESELHPNLVEFSKDQASKTLGIMWSHLDDCFMYKTRLSINTPKITKRMILSELSQIFDPIGFLSPITIIPKLIMQELWLEKLTWDEPVPENIASKWKNFKADLEFIKDLKLKRYCSQKGATKHELHGFCDASKRAFGACVYLVTYSNENECHSQLLCAKSKVAPLKPVTIPRLELCGAVLLSRLVKKYLESTTLKLDKCFLWTDSTIILGWLKTPTNLLKLFVANRIGEIQDATKHFSWRHVPTNENPADLVSRGVSPSQLMNLTLWWHGPKFITRSQSEWPTHDNTKCTLPEVICAHTKTSKPDTSIFERYGSITKLKMVIAYIFRFTQNTTTPKINRNTGPLQVQELQTSLSKIVRLSQTATFSNEIKQLERGLPIKNGKLLGLNPFLDDQGIIRIGGRLNNSNFAISKKHPIVLCGKHVFTKLLFKEEHVRLLHAGPQHLLASIREKFWPLSGRNLAKLTVHSCVKCFRANPKVTQPPLMGDLPAERVTPNPPFHTTGIDFAGPVLIKNKKGRGCRLSKAYICLFICFATKAIHLELLSDLTTNCFILALKRFTSRRGLPANIYTDNGKTFVGARSHLRDLGKFLLKTNKELSDVASTLSLNWRFIPAYSPHFGGLWEAGIKSVKHHLKRVVGNASLTYEDLYSLLVQIEAVLNSRPLTPLSPDPSELLPLTPAHFLIGRPTTSLPEDPLDDVPLARLSHFQRLQQLKAHFWERWSKEYIGELQQRIKWKSTSPPLQPGTMVLLKQDKVPPQQWKLGRITSCIPGKDNISRVFEIKTQDGEVRRSWAKLCPLPDDATDIPR